jgi:hypothetical protein
MDAQTTIMFRATTRNPFECNRPKDPMAIVHPTHKKCFGINPSHVSGNSHGKAEANNRAQASAQPEGPAICDQRLSLDFIY